MPHNSTVTVITATTGHPGLARCIGSVQRQSHPAQHLVVVDGPDWIDRVDAVLARLDAPSLPKLIRLPHATGKGTWNGHRIYGAMPFIVPSDYVCWLDEDNWFDADHVESLLNAAAAIGSPWAFSLRKIVDGRGEIITLDQCESLGPLHHTILARDDFHIDTSCYLVRRDVAIALAAVWNRIARPPAQEGPGPDRLLCRMLMQHFPPGAGTRRYSLNYTVGNTPESVRAEFFLKGNQVMHDHYRGGLPWENQA